MMNIHLSRPGGQREGPFTLDQINNDLAASKYRETDYWAWYEGLTEWVPLHQVPGIVRSRPVEPPEAPPNPEFTAGDTEILYNEDSTTEQSTAQSATSEQSPVEQPGSEEPEAWSESAESEIEETEAEEPAPEPSGSEEAGLEETVSEVSESEDSPSEESSSAAPIDEHAPASEEAMSEEASGEPTEEAVTEETASQEPEPEEISGENPDESQPHTIPPSLASQLHSGMAFEALEQILLLSSGDPQAASRSAVTSGMLEAVAGQDLTVIREKIPRDAMGGCVFLEKLRGGGSIPEAALRAASTLKPELVRQAREGLYRICVRTYPIETGEMVALFLFYNKQLL